MFCSARSDFLGFFLGCQAVRTSLSLIGIAVRPVARAPLRPSPLSASDSQISAFAFVYCIYRRCIDYIYNYRHIDRLHLYPSRADLPQLFNVIHLIYAIHPILYPSSLQHLKQIVSILIHFQYEKL